ncbi:MAG: fused MFS/spermidine synthase [Proteobacteria bacterium]|nr:fused MFS/spermidine synthase [Pseudomonadota bacterium]
MNFRLFSVALLLFGSGACALVYQVAWLRELRLVFGASTAASAAVLAIFMGGLGLGGLILGRRADRHPNALRLYAHLELSIAGSALVTPYLILAVRHVYVWLGGGQSLGDAGAVVVRLALSALVLGLPTFLMGGTLPAAAKAVENEADAGRRRTALLYGFNTLGAVCGAVAATFFMLEILGTHHTLWAACLLNLLVGLTARSRSRSWQVGEVGGPERSRESAEILRAAGTASPAFVLPAAFLVGFAFLLMELVWYRMLGPLLGGSTYTFGLILAAALSGIGLGGAAYAFRAPSERATLGAFALTCALEACFMAVPYALGDRLAVMAALLHPLGQVGLGGQVIGWSLIAGLAVFPAALVSGYQFPLLIGLLGRGGRQVGRHTGLAYAWNTGGAILGSLAGGFLLMPWLTATGTWKGAIILLALLGGVAALLALVWERRRAFLVLPAGVLACALVMLTAMGPTAVWRHSPIGAGRVNLNDMQRNGIQKWMNKVRRGMVWEADGREVSVGLTGGDGLAFVINGKVDGNARGDAATQVMLGLVSAVLHPNPRTAMVIGLGTGSSAGWLAEIPSIERVDVAELEPDILEVARRCAPVNRNVLDNPKVNVIIADGREVLLTAKDQYDLIVSEPSNPYRAGIASLYTLEFYQAVARCLAPGGMFSQWVQAYEVDTRTIRTIYATLSAVFPVVETWQTMTNDMLLVCSMKPRSPVASDLRRRLAEPPFREVFPAVWGTTDLEGFLSRFVAGPGLTRTAAAQDLAKGWLNTDDWMLVEFGFAQTVGRLKAFSLSDLEKAARKLDQHRPAVQGEVDWDRVDENRIIMYGMDRKPPHDMPWFSKDRRHRVEAYEHFLKGEYKKVLDAWAMQPRRPEYPLEQAMLADALAETGDPEALDLIEGLRVHWPADADAILARYHFRGGRVGEAVEALKKAFLRNRRDPWCNQLIMFQAIRLAKEMAGRNKKLAPELFDLLTEPLAVSILDEHRLRTLLEIASLIDKAHTISALDRLEPHVPWDKVFLTRRAAVYQAAGDPRAAGALADLDAFLRDAPVLISESLAE